MRSPTNPNQSANVTVRGVTAASGTQWVNITKGLSSAWSPHRSFATDERATRGRLAEQGVVLVAASWRQALEDVSRLEDFPAEAVAEQPGWVGASFALPDGTIFSPEGSQPPQIIFNPDASRCGLSGSMEGWIQRVARPLDGQSLPMFLLMAAFAAPIIEFTARSENFGFEVVGRPGCGKSTSQFLMSSALGGIRNTSAGKYWIAFDTTLDGLESAMQEHSSLPMIINEANLFYAHLSEKARATQLKALVFRLAQGHDKRRYGAEKPQPHRFVYVTSSNVSLATMIAGENGDVADAAFDRLMTLEVPDRCTGVFDFIPEGYANAEAFANRQEKAAHRHHGHAIRQFLAELVNERARGEKRLLRQIDKHMKAFRTKAASLEGVSTGRVAEAFALVYAAGKLAQRYGALPNDWHCGRAALACYRQMLEMSKRRPSFDLLLDAVLRKPGVVDLDCSNVERLDDNALAAIPAFLKTNRNGQREVLFHPPTLEEAIPGWKALINADGVRAFHTHDGDRLTKKRPVRSGTTDRMVCIVLSGDEN